MWSRGFDSLPSSSCFALLCRVLPVLPSSRLAVLFSRREFGLVDVGTEDAVGRVWGVVSDSIPTCHGASFRGFSIGRDSLSAISSGFYVGMCFYIQTFAVNLLYVYKASQQLRAVQVSV